MFIHSAVDGLAFCFASVDVIARSSDSSGRAREAVSSDNVLVDRAETVAVSVRA